MKSIAIHQPNYIPWPGYFYKIYQSDVFVFLDDVQFSNEGMHCYHYLKTPKGPLRLKIPVVQTLGDKIADVKIRNEIDWVGNHLNQIYLYYNKAKYFDEVYADYKALTEEPQVFLADLNIKIVEFICRKLGISLNYIRSSQLNICSSRSQKIIDICKALGGTTYYSGVGAKAYQKEEDFLQNGIRLLYSEYKVFEYDQLYSGFQSNVSILDFLMNNGYRWDMVLEKQINN